MRIQLTYRYRLLLYFLILTAFIALGFTVYTLQKTKDYSLSALQKDLNSFNSDIYVRTSNGTPYDRIEIPQKEMNFTVLDSAGYVLYFSGEKENSFEEDQSSKSEMVQAAATGEGNSLRSSATLIGEYLYYVKEYGDIFIRTSIKFRTEKPTQIQEDNKYMLMLTVLIIALGVAIFLIFRKLTKPLKSFNQFVSALESPQKDLSKVEFEDDDFGAAGRKIADTFSQLEKTKRYKQQMSHNIAHELKTPVTGIRAYLETILHTPDMPQDQVNKFISKAYAQTIRLSELIGEVSTLNKLDEGGSAYTIETLNIRKVLQDVMEEIGYKLEANHIKFESLISTSLKLNGCYTLVYSLFKNLIDNTIEHGGPNCTIILNAGIDQIAGENGYKINFTYSDTGLGVPADSLKRIFERFYRVEEGRTRRTGGSGLGLAIVKNAVIFHKGTITAENRIGGGITFKFSLYSLDGTDAADRQDIQIPEQQDSM